MHDPYLSTEAAAPCLEVLSLLAHIAEMYGMCIVARHSLASLEARHIFARLP